MASTKTGAGLLATVALTLVVLAIVAVTAAPKAWADDSEALPSSWLSPDTLGPPRATLNSLQKGAENVAGGDDSDQPVPRPLAAPKSYLRRYSLPRELAWKGLPCRPR